MDKPRIVVVVGPTASGKTSRAIEIAKERDGEVISVDSRQVYRGLDIGTEKISKEEMGGIPHHLIDIRDPEEVYSAGDFVSDARSLISDITSRGKLPVLAGGTHFYIDALLFGLPEGTPKNEALRMELEELSDAELLARIQALDPRRAKELDPKNRRRLVRALEIIDAYGSVPARENAQIPYEVEWVVVSQKQDVLKERIATRLKGALDRGLIEEVARVRERVGDARLNELGLEYKIVGEYLREERDRESVEPALLSKLLQYARRQRAWLRKLGLT